jgi:25S rRNA (cytosine2278-C5)-methyltransferase
MSLYHETAEILSAPPTAGGNLKSRVFGRKDLKAPPGQVYALAVETCKWSAVLKEVVDESGLLRHERKVLVSFISYTMPYSYPRIFTWLRF